MKRIVNFAAILWALSCYLFAAFVVFVTRGFTHDPNFTTVPSLPRGAEADLLPIMLGIIFLGMASFGIMLLAWVITLVKKSKSEYKPRIATKFAFIAQGILVLLIVVSAVAFRAGNQGYRQSNYNGEQLLNAVNEYRTAHNLQIVKVDQFICDNLVERYLAIKNPNSGHAGFEEWIKSEEIDKRFAPVAELYVVGTEMPQDAINTWVGSPGHKIQLDNPEWTVGCAYANQTGEGVAGVVVLGVPIK